VDAPAVRFALSGTDAGNVELAGVTAAQGPVEAANAVTPIALLWRSDQPPPVLGVSVRLTDELGQIWAQHDYEPLGGISPSVAQSEAKGLATIPTEDSSLPSTAQNDSAGGWQATDRLGLLIPAGTPPGRYTVELLVHPKGSDRSLEASGADGKPLETPVSLFGLDVVPADQPVALERLPIAIRTPVDMGDGLRFLGYSADNQPVVPGDLRKVSLFWQATAQPANDHTAFTQADFRIPASVPDGRYHLIAGLFRADNKAVLRTAAGADHLSLGTITVRGRPHEMTPPQPQHPADATFSDIARLIGYNLASAEMRPGGALDLTLHWQALTPADRAYTVFVHLLDEAGMVKGYGDSEPGGGAYPTTGWLQDEYLADTHTVTIAADALPGTYRLAIGLYDPVAGERLRLPDGADQVVLETSVEVK
jgi:hypothetical protein